MIDGAKHEIDAVNHDINGAYHVKWSESQYRWSESHQVLCNLVKPNIGFFNHVESRRIYWDSLHMIEGVNQDIDGANYQVVRVLCSLVELNKVYLS